MDRFNKMDNNKMDNKQEALTLSKLNERVHDAINARFPDMCWVCAETSDVRVNHSSGHCYLEFVEKDVLSAQIAAKARGMIWAQTFRTLKPYFEQETGQAFVSGLKVLVKVSVEFHKLYGYSLTVHDIEPSYTMGDMVKRRQEIIRRLQDEGILDLNRELPLSRLPQRIAVITSLTAAGYGDFMNQLLHNPAGYPFYVKLFPAIMQGEKTEESIITALDRICHHATCFDAVVMIRGGGSAVDLNCFDSYQLASHCAQFPLPVITGIGHERDDSIVDLVAHTRMKTPTAVADFLIGRMNDQAEELLRLQQSVCAGASSILAANRTEWKMIASRFPSLVMHRIEQSRMRLQSLRGKLAAAHLLIMKRSSLLSEIKQHLRNRTLNLLEDKSREIAFAEQYLTMASPDYILKRGYALILKEDRIIKQATALAGDDEIRIRFADGEQTAVIK
jgi:exodeoxyribonuclease VII large subunit